MPQTLTCAHCGGGLGPEDRYCAQCGFELFTCGVCGHALLPSDWSCPGCSTPVDLGGMNAGVGSNPDEWVSPWDDMMERLRRATLGEYEIGRELGRGGMAAVFLAHEIALDRNVAIKVMMPGLLLGDGMIERFRREAITMGHLHHPHIVSVYSVRQAEGLHFFVMRYVQGRSLEQVIQQAGKLPLAVVRSIVYQVGSALTYAHRSRVIHRDIKPANIIIDQEGNAAVTDFGIAKAAEAPTNTITGALVGTPAYMSPEQCGGSEVSWAADQYALGAVAYEMLTGTPPFSGSTLTVMQAHVERPPVAIRDLRPDCPPELEAAVLRMLAKDPADRWLRMPDAMAALGALPLAEDDPLRAELSRLAVPAEDGALPDGFASTRESAAAPGSSASGRSPGRPVGAISILPPASGLEVGDSFVLVATVRGQHGTRLPPTAVSWRSDVEGVLEFDPEGGVATAVGAGVTLLTATCRGVKAVLRIEVVAPKADEIVICPLDQALHVGDEVRLEALVRDKRGQPISRPVRWQSADPPVATVDDEGAVVALVPGLARIAAVSDGAHASLVVPVLPARVAAIRIEGQPASAQRDRTFLLTATPVDRWGGPLADRQVVWSSSDAHVAVVTAGGKVNPLRPGSVVLTASCDGVSESVRIDIAGAPAAAGPPAPAAVRDARPTVHRRFRRHRRSPMFITALLAVLAGGALGFIAYGTQPSLSDLRGRLSSSFTSPGNPSGSVPASVAMTSSAAPPRPVSLDRPAVEGRQERSPPPPPAARVRTPSAAATRPGVASLSVALPDELRVGDTTTLAATVLGARGDRLAGRAVTWSSSDASVVSVDPRTGAIRALAPGTAVIIAESGGRSSRSELTVVAQPVAAVTVHGARPMRVGERLRLRAESVGEQGEPLPGRPVMWASSDIAIATVDATSGVVTARSAGRAEIIATSQGRSGRVRLVVSPRRESTAPAAAGDARQVEAIVLAGVEECYDALRARNVARVREMYRPATDSDEDNLRKLSRILQTKEWSASIAERVFGQRRIRTNEAAMEFTFRLTWRDAFGGRLSSRPVFRAEFVRQGDRWQMSSCRIVGNPQL